MNHKTSLYNSLIILYFGTPIASNQIMKKVLTLICFLLLAGATQAQDSTSKATLPSLSLKDMDGNTVNVKDLADSGKITIFSFWATWCGPCKKELKNIFEILEDWEEDYNVKLVAVCTDNSRNTVKVKPFVNGQGWTFPVIMDTNQDFQRAMNAPNIPFTVVVDGKGNIVYTHLGYVEGDEFELEKKLKEIKAGQTPAQH